MTLPSPITLDPNAAVGAVLATSLVAIPSPSNTTVTCYIGKTTIGVVSSVGSLWNDNPPTYSTNVAGVGYRILHPDSSYILPPWGSDSINGSLLGTNYPLDVGSALQLVKTGPIASGARVLAGTLGYWQYGGLLGHLRVEDFVLANDVTFEPPSCTVTTPDIAVALPTVSNTALAGTGATAGATAFTIGLNCSVAGRSLAIQFDTAQSFAGANGVIIPTAGTASNVGVQLLDGSLAPTIVFGTPATVGTTPNGLYELTYYARYYATAASVSPGTLTATATFTISYP